jgi:hypothetical protein
MQVPLRWRIWESGMPRAKKQASATKTPCEIYIEEHPEVLSGFSITISGAEVAVLRVKACRATLRILTFLERDKPGGCPRVPIADTSNVRDEWIEISLQAINSVEADQKYVLTWVVDSPSTDWQLVSELILDGTVHYRHLKKTRPGVINAEVLFVKVRS